MTDMENQDKRYHSPPPNKTEAGKIYYHGRKRGMIEFQFLQRWTTFFNVNFSYFEVHISDLNLFYSTVM